MLLTTTVSALDLSPWLHILFVGLSTVGFSAFVLSVIWLFARITTGRRLGKTGVKRMVSPGPGFAVLAGSVLLLVVSVMIAHADNGVRADTVQAWADDNYSLHLTQEQASSLSRGKTVAVDYPELRNSVKLKETGQGWRLFSSGKELSFSPSDKKAQ